MKNQNSLKDLRLIIIKLILVLDKANNTMCGSMSMKIVRLIHNQGAFRRGKYSTEPSFPGILI